MASAGRSEAPSRADCQLAFERGVACALHLWPDLTFAVDQNSGGGDSVDKRDWFAGQLVDLFPDLNFTPGQLRQRAEQSEEWIATEEAEKIDVETRILDIMLDEFEFKVDDDDASAFELAEQICRLRAECLSGKLNGGEADELARRYEAQRVRQAAAGTRTVRVVIQREDGEHEEEEWDTDGEDAETEEGEAVLSLVPIGTIEKNAPEVDEEGFTLVTKKR